MIFLNIDLGELPDEPEALYQVAQVANVACGGHAGDDASMARAVAACRAHGTYLGAHPSYPDRQDFGRKALDLTPTDLLEAVRAQCARLRVHAVAAGIPITHLKAHGALYQAVDAEPDLAEAFLEGAGQALGAALTVIGPTGGPLEAAAQRRVLSYAREGFADRGRRRGADGRWQLVPRGEPGAILAAPEEAAAQARLLREEGELETICVHGDHPHALEIARAVREALA